MRKDNIHHFPLCISNEIPTFHVMVKNGAKHQGSHESLSIKVNLREEKIKAIFPEIQAELREDCNNNVAA